MQVKGHTKIFEPQKMPGFGAIDNCITKPTIYQIVLVKKFDL